MGPLRGPPRSHPLVAEAAPPRTCGDGCGHVHWHHGSRLEGEAPGNRYQP